MRTMNRVMLVGRLGRDPELRETRGGSTWMVLSVATDRRRKDGDTWVDETDWHRVKVFGRQAQVLSTLLYSGAQVGVDGMVQVEKWNDDAGKAMRSVVVVGQQITLLSPRREVPVAASSAPTALA